MTVTAFEGPAGSGKTHRLMDELVGELERRPLATHERVMALTFMHGARRRLDARLREIDGLAGRFEATTLDSFAWRLTQRWRRLVLDLGHAIPGEDQYDETCTLAAALLQRPAVLSWVGMSYPLILVDEAQDLKAERSAIIAALTSQCSVLLAFDEFQCLNPANLPIAIASWLRDTCEPTALTGCRRTDDAELIAAAGAVRDGRAVEQDGKRFKVALTPGKPNLAATYLANAIAWRQGGNVAVLTPSRAGGFADSVIALVCAGPVGKQKNGPFPITWESSDAQDGEALWQQLAMPDRCSVADALAALHPHRGAPAVRTARDWITRQRNARGVQEVAATQVRRQLDRAVSARRRYGGKRQAEFTAMTIQQAKNREFDHVVIIWPYTIPDDAEQKRRLLYNAITRAKRSCLVLVQGKELLGAPPFVA